MSLTVHAVNPEREREALLALLEANLPLLSHRRRFEWLYRANPAGPAWSWLVCDTGARQPVGVASVFPRMTWVGGTLERGGQVGDFAVTSSHRTLGPALALQRATLALVDEKILSFCYDCPPHETALATFRRLGLDVTRRTERHARLLKTDRQFARRLGPGRLSKGVATLANAVLAQTRGRPRRASGVELDLFTGTFGDEFTALDRRLVAPGIRGRRSAEDLTWRYGADPLHRYEVITARRRGELLAFVTFATDGGDTHVVDLFGELADLALPLLDAVAEHVSATPVQTLQLVLAEDPAISPRLREAGFRLRSTGPSVVAYAPSGSRAAQLFDRPDAWLLRQADLLA